MTGEGDEGEAMTQPSDAGPPPGDTTPTGGQGGHVNSDTTRGPGGFTGGPGGSSGGPGGSTGGPGDATPTGGREPGATAAATVQVQREPWLTPRRLANLVLVLVAAYAALTIIRALRSVLVMIAVSLFLSFAMEPAVQWLHRRGMRRGPATAVVFAIVILLLIGFVALMLPLLISQLTDLARNVPNILDQLDADLVSRLPLGIDISASPDLQRELTAFASQLGEQLRAVLLGAAGEVVEVGATAVGLLFQLATIGLVTFYLVADGPRARRTLAAPLAPTRQREMLAIWEIAVEKTGGYIYSRVLLAAAATLAHGAFFLAIDLPSPIPLAVWIGVTSAFIPVVGTYLGAFAALLVAFVSSPIDALFVAIFAVAYQQLENYVLAPRIQSRTMDVHPAIAFMSVVIGGSLLGAVGALLALPATAVVQALLSTYVRRHELIAELSDVTLPHDLEPPGTARPMARRPAVLSPTTER
jgi:predicted PurR-regulated permease PerM